MASAASEAAIATLRGSVRPPARGADDGAAAAWLCAIPCAAIAVLAIIVLGPPLGRLITPAPSAYAFLPGAFVHPEPTEHARYLIAICAPLLGALAIVAAPRRLARVPAHLAAAVALATQAALVATIVGSIVTQYGLRFGFSYTYQHGPSIRMRYFTPATLAVGGLLAAATAVVLRCTPLRRRGAPAVLAESRARRLLAAAAAVAATAIWMLPALHTDASLANAVENVRYHLSFTLDETFAVLNGRTPLVDFSAQYGSLWPFAVALPMLAFGKTVLVFTLALCTITALTLLTSYGVLRRVTRSATAALLLYLPVLATSLFQTEGTLGNRASVGTYTGIFPLRYGLPFLVAWLTAREIERGERERPRPLGAWLLFTVAGLAILNNGDFGFAALGAAIAALLWAAPAPRARAALLRLGAALAAGLATALALVALLTLARTGSPPHLWRLVDYAGVYAVGGWTQMPIPSVLGMHLLVYLTYVAAILAATVRALRGARNRVLTGMLAWAGVFGLGAGMYYVGRSHPTALKYEFPAWALALSLLTVVAVQDLAAPRLRRTALGALVALFGFGLAAGSLAQTPTPWGQLQRLQATAPHSAEEPDRDPLVPPRDARTRRFVASLADGPGRFVVQRGAPVAILLTTGHRVADAYGVVNVSPYTGIESLPTAQRVNAVLDALRDAGGNTAIVPIPFHDGLLPILERRGFELLTAHGLRRVERHSHVRPLERSWPGGQAIMKWVDARRLHPRALKRARPTRSARP
jgi:hypothetical protein